MTRKNFNMSLADRIVSMLDDQKVGIPYGPWQADSRVGRDGYGMGLSSGKRRVERVHDLIRRAEKFCISDAVDQAAEARYLKTPTERLASGLRLPFPLTWMESDVDKDQKCGYLLGEEEAGYVWSIPFAVYGDQVLMHPIIHIGVINDAVVVVPLSDGQHHRELMAQHLQKLQGLPKGFLNETAHHPYRVMNVISDVSQAAVSPNSIPQGRFYAKGKFRPYFGHRVVNIVIDAIPTVREENRNVMSSPKRRHMVRGFWRKHPLTKQRTVFIEAHARGDASLGWVYHDYDVRREEE